MQFYSSAHADPETPEAPLTPPQRAVLEPSHTDRSLSVWCRLQSWQYRQLLGKAHTVTTFDGAEPGDIGYASALF